ncbi:hypothetical protein BRC83_00815 [Halobacteriales archaeon QS_1_68_17]|nr:MAG: hypothetical protein BRC83_00815 [Halobacteriales archaeon QS_1_68_17]
MDFPAGFRLAAPTVPVERPSYVELVFALVVVWGFCDAVSTLVALTATGTPGLEANPLIRVLLATEPLLLIGLKGAVMAYVGVVLLGCRPLVERVPAYRGWLFGMLGFGIAVVLSNLTVGLRALA